MQPNVRLFKPFFRSINFGCGMSYWIGATIIFGRPFSIGKPKFLLEFRPTLTDPDVTMDWMDAGLILSSKAVRVHSPLTTRRKIEGERQRPSQAAGSVFSLGLPNIPPTFVVPRPFPHRKSQSSVPIRNPRRMPTRSTDDGRRSVARSLSGVGSPVRCSVGSIPYYEGLKFHSLGNSYGLNESVPYEESHSILPYFEELTHH